MIKAKKLVALMLAFLMIFSSASVLATAMSDTVDAGTALNITTKFFKEVDGTWVETTKVEANDTVKARVYLDTDYYAADSTLLFFYDKDFFTHSYAGQHNLEMNGDAASFAAVNGITGSFVTNANLESQVDYGYISADQLNDYGVFAANIAIKDGNTVMFDGSDWLFEFTLTVAADAAGEGDLFTVEELYQNTTRTEAYGDVPKGEQGGVGTDAWPMWSWDAAFTFESQPVTTISSITFNANGGAFADGNDTFGPVEGTINTTIADGVLPADPTYAGYTFLGWVDAEIADPTESDIVAAPATYPEDDLVLNAYWVKNVNITFADTGDTTIDPITNVTPNTAFKDIINPTKAGYTFVGWNVRGGELPEVYPSVDTTYTAIWATNVEVSFETNGADAIAPVKGYEGAPFEATIDDPEKEGHYFVGWILQGGDGKLVDLPTVFPATDVTYEAIFDTYTYYVMYYVKNVKTGETTPYFLQAEYGAEIGFPKVNVPEGYAMDSQWYTDPDCTVPFVAGTTMGTAPVSLYTTIDIEPYKAYFLLEQGDDLADAYAVVDAEYLEPITAPAPPTKEGYEFAGWTPYVGILDKEEDVVFYATWNEKVHNVTYYLNDDTTTVYEAYDVPFNGDLEVPAAPVREGYTFIGWNTDATATEAIEIVGTKMPDGDVAYYAIWEVNEYTVTFDSNEGTAVEDKTQAYKSSVTAPAEPTREGYKFVAWKDADDKAVTFPFEMPAHDVALKAEWKLESYTLTFAETGDSVYEDKVVKYGDTIEAVEDPVKAGYKFLAWSPAVPTEIGDLGDDGDTITYTAQWKQEEYTLKFVDTGDTVIADKVVKMGDTISVPAELTKDGQGYYFTGWDVTPPTTIADMGNDGDEFTYTALWDKESYTLKFADTNDAGDVITEVVTFGEAFAAPTGLTKTGYVFDGWDVTPPTTIEDMGNNGAEITYTAQWAKETYIFHFTNTGDTTVADATVTYGDTYKAPEGLTKTGYTHTGWDPVVPATITDLGEDKQEFTFAATWAPKTIDVTFDGNNGLVDGAATKVVPTEFDSDIVAPAAARDGYAFVGWSTDKGATVGTTELGKLTTETPATYYAIWSASSANYTVEFYYMNVDGTDYVLADDETKTFAGVVDQAVPTYVPGEVTGFTFNAGKSTVDGTVPATGTLTLKVYYDRNKYNLTYEGNAPVEVYFGTAAADMPAAVTEPTKVGNYFTGWEALPATMPADDVAIAAKWTVETYVFKFADTGDMPLDDETVTYGGKFTAATDLTKTGYVFEGWDPEVPTDITDLGDNGDEFTFTAQWKAETYVFRFTNLYGNTVADATVTYGGTYTAPTGLVRVGFTHTGWDPTVPTAITEDLGEDGEVFEFAAKWSRNSHTLLIDNDNGSEIETLTRPFEAQISEPAAPSKTGYDFSHWINSADGTTVTFPFSMPDEDVSIKAVYTEKTYVLKFADTGDQVIADMPVKFGDTVTVPTGLTKDGEGVYFTGWDNPVPTKIEDMGASGSEFTYTAQWTEETYKISFTETGDTAVEDMTVTYGQTITLPTGLTKEKQGLYFTGEFKDAQGNALTATIGDLGDNNASVSYAAQWDKESYTLTFTNLFGNTVADIPVTYGDTITVPDGLTRTGYTFTGWDPALEATIGDLGNNGETISYAAKWDAKVINVTFDGNNGTIEGVATKVVPTTFDQPIVAPTADRTGYTFVGWSTNKDDTTGVTNLGNLTTETPDTYYAIWSADAKQYTVEFYEMNVDGKDYTKLDKTEKLNGTVGKETATYVPAEVTGFTVNADMSTLKGTVPADGELILKVYYDRNKYNLTYEGNAPVEVYFGTAAADMPAAATEPTKDGHFFAGWASLPATMPADDVTITANWTVETYNIIFADTNDAGDEITATVTFGGAITAPTGLVKTGHVFAGWSPEVPATAGDLGDNGDTITYTAQWTKETYTLTFTNLFGNTVADIPVTYGDTITVPEGLTRTGYTFAGWDPALEATIGDLGADKATVSYAAKWDAKVINVTFDANNGTIEGAATKDVPTTFDQPIVAPKAERDGYTFAGWSTDKNATVGTNNLGNLTTETPDTYYAIWSADGAKYTVEFYEMDLDGVNYTLVGSDNTLEGVVDQPVDTYVPAAKTGFTVNYDKSVLDGTVPATGTLVLKVYYDRESYKLTYKGAGSDHASYDVLYGTPVAQWPVPDTAPERTGYYFDKWNASSEATMPAKDVSITAAWLKESYTIKFDTVDGTPVADITAAYGDPIIVPDDPTKAGHVFAGWSDVIPDVMPDYGDNGEIITITASWTKETYVLKFADTGDTAIADKTVTFGDTIEAVTGLTKVGHVFAGWDVTPPTEIGDLGEDGAEITYTAQWTKETYTLIFANTNDAGEAITKKVTFGDTIEVPADLTKTGHKFTGWDVTPPTTIGDLGEDKATLIYNAQWANETYIFHFTNTGDTTVADATVTYGDTYKAPEGLTKTGYTHTGWDPVVPATITDLGEDKQEFTFAATWAPKTIDVTFDGNNGLVDGAATKVVPTEFDSDIVAPAAARDGYAFVGWSTDKGATVGTTELGKLTTETPATYYAIWSASSANYTVEFYYMNVDGTDYVLADDETKTFAGVVDQAVPTYVPGEVTGFAFNAGMSTVDGTVPSTGTLTLKVYYDRDKFTVTYEGNEPVEVYFGAEIPAAAKEPTKEGNYFVKWNNALTEMPADDLVIAAEWATESYKLTFGDLYGNVVDDMTVKYGDKITVPAGLTREGYVFDGWSPELTETIGDLGNNGDTVTYTAKWSLDQFTITIKLDGGNIDGDTADVVITKNFGEAVSFTDKPVKEGYTFVDWSVTIPETMPAEDMTITAIWQINTYTITFNEDGGSEVADITAQYGAAITAPAAPTKEGHVFAGWSEELPATMPDYGANGASHEIKATWTAETYVLKFADTGDTAIADKTVTYGDTIEAVTGLTKVGHVFAGWDVTPPTEIGDLGVNGAEITYTAQWTKETYTLIFADTNDAGDSITMNVTFGDTIEVPADLTKTGHKFAGWDVTPPTEIGDLGAGEAVLTYTAQWTKNSYTVTWVDEAGSKEETVVYGDAITAPTAAAKEGYYFVMWTPEVPATMPAENLTFTALYEVSVYNVNYYVDGKFVTGYTAEYGEVIRTENTGYTVPTGYVFDGWYTDAACTTKLAENATVGAQVVNLYAKTTAGTFTANFWLDDAKTELYYTANVVFDKEIRLPDTLEAPTKTGYIFAGWDPYVGLMDEEGKDFVAVWYENDVVTATFYVDGAVYEMFDNLTYGAEMEIPAPPVKAGHRFDGWALKGTTDIVDLQGTTVPAESVEYEAIFTITEFYVTYNNYVASEFGPAGTPTPAYEAYAIDGAEVKNAYNLGDAIVHPAAPVVAVVKDGTTHTEYYTFSHWEDADGNVWADGAAMPANDVALYAKYDRADVYLAVIEGTTGVIEKAHATDTEQWYVYGFTGRRFNEAEVPKMFEVKGDGYYEIEMSELSGLFGTGAKLKVYDRLTDELVEEYYVIYFGDINGDGRVNTADTADLGNELASPSWSGRRNGVPYRIKAADLDCNGRINTNDSAALANVVSKAYTIDQETGFAE